MFKPIFIVISILLVCSCNEKGEQNSTVVNLKNDILVIKDIDNTELKLYRNAKDSLTTLLKNKDIFSSETLWCVIQVNEKAMSLPSPSGVSDDTTAHEIDWGKHYVIWISSSSEEKEVFTNLREERDNQAQPFLEIEWDLVVRVNFERDQLLQTIN